MKKFLIGFLIVVIVANLPFINKHILHSLDDDTFKYSNNDASFTYTQGFGFKDSYFSKDINQLFIQYDNPEPINQEIFRLYKINPLCFWRWYYYIVTSLHFKYKSWSDIEPYRVPYEKYKSRWQEF